jgi:hypothetical protein
VTGDRIYERIGRNVWYLAWASQQEEAGSTRATRARAAEKYIVEIPKVQSEVQNDPLRIPIPWYKGH